MPHSNISIQNTKILPMCLQMKVLEEPTDVMGSAVSHKEIQKIDTAASESIESLNIGCCIW